MQIQQAFDLIKDDIKRVEEGFRSHLDSSVFLINKVVEYILSSGGKRFRPLLLILASRLGGYRGDAHIPLCCVIEFIHTATLLHDDVVDNAELRRGAASANTIWGNGASVLVGDYLLSKAFYLAVAHNDIRILDVLSNTTTLMAEGEVLQLLKHADADATEEDYMDVVTKKTAVLFSAACQVAAILGGQSRRKEEELAAFGMEIGIAYQLADDCLDYISRDEALGKSIGNDLKEGKVTLPLIKALTEADDDERAIMRRAIEEDGLEEGELQQVLALINKYDGIGYTMTRARALVESAKRRLDCFEPTPEKAALLAVADYVISRSH
ncbi:MAG TPA: polyprenyl synthetase family protein [Deltaproteobacteria bacterium]|nr:polyprenyl synthetase family protein [Deltaproteobacteria bacterium]